MDHTDVNGTEINIGDTIVYFSLMGSSRTIYPSRRVVWELGYTKSNEPYIRAHKTKESPKATDGRITNLRNCVVVEKCAD